MINAKIQKGGRAAIEANGTTKEILSDILVLINAIHTQFQNADPETAVAFRVGLTGMLANSGSPVWKPCAGQTGIIFQKPEQED